MPVSNSIIQIFAFLLLSVSVHAQLVYKTPSGAKYHLAGCKTVKNSSEQITIARAAELGLAPCKICKPPASGSMVLGSAINKAQGEGKTVQCRGLTKLGARCKHMTRIGNGYCFQHQPK